MAEPAPPNRRCTPHGASQPNILPLHYGIILVENKLLPDTLCLDHDIASDKKSHVTQHIKSSAHEDHVKIQEATNSASTSRQTTLDHYSGRDEFITDLCEMFLAMDIPLYKSKHIAFHKFIEKYIKKTVPSETSLRSTHMPRLHRRLLLEDGPSPPYLIAVKQLEQTNQNTESRCVDEALKKARQLVKNKQLPLDLVCVSSCFGFLAGKIKQLEDLKLSLSKSISILDEVITILANQVGPRATLVNAKLTKVLQNNTGLTFMRQAAKILEGDYTGNTANVMDLLTVKEVTSLKYAQLTSCDVERSFSIYKTVLTDRHNGARFATHKAEDHGPAQRHVKHSPLCVPCIPAIAGYGSHIKTYTQSKTLRVPILKPVLCKQTPHCLRSTSSLLFWASCYLKTTRLLRRDMYGHVEQMARGVSDFANGIWEDQAFPEINEHFAHEGPRDAKTRSTRGSSSPTTEEPGLIISVVAVAPKAIDNWFIPQMTEEKILHEAKALYPAHIKNALITARVETISAACELLQALMRRCPSYPCTE
ncbi:hypothetical protein B566_EDAN013830 [Ephemera danica]|nr:hypothetical protein B566_EDAN013830 [Ephemera danica]